MSDAAAEVAPAVGERAGHGAQREHRADRQVDAADEDHEQLPDRQARERRDLHEHVREVVAGEEVRRRQGQDHHEQREDQGRARADHAQRQAAAPALRSRPRDRASGWPWPR